MVSGQPFGVGIVVLVLVLSDRKEMHGGQDRSFLLAQAAVHMSELQNLRHPGESRHRLPAWRGNEKGAP